MATPLSGALLHVEVVRRALAREKIENPELEKSVGAVGEGLDQAARLLEELGEKVTGSSEPAEFSGADVVRKAAGGHAELDAGGRIALEFPQGEAATTLFGRAEEILFAVSDITAFALENAGPGALVTWTVSSLPGEKVLCCRFASTLAPERLEGIRSSWRPRTDGAGAAGGGLLFAVWAIEAQGGRFSLDRKEGILEVRAIFAP